LDEAHFSTGNLAEFYRFALLLTGKPEAAQRVMAETLAEWESRHGDVRNAMQRNVWLATRLRKHCLANHGPNGEQTAPRLMREHGEDLLEIEAFILARHFHKLPEPERSALGLFYLNVFNPDDIAEMLAMTVEELAEHLSKARALLRDSLRRDRG
jgi:DNA-directed RNA polymerase specialized sigma24 family protein